MNNKQPRTRNKKIKVVVTDYIEPDLAWERKQFTKLGLDFSAHQLKSGSPEQILAVAADADILIVNMATIDSPVITGLDHCRLIIRHGVGYDNVDIAAATVKGITVAYVPDYCVHEVAEQATMLILASQRRFPFQRRALRESVAKGEWDFSSMPPVHSLYNKTLGIIGFGRIGSTVYGMMQGFGMRVMVCDPYLSEARRQVYAIETYPLEPVLKEADVITIHTPLDETTYHLFGEPEFKMMKKTATLINTARGGIVDLRALDRALSEGEIAYAAIDVYEEREPPDPDLPLLHNERAICTPHLSWLSEESAWHIREKIVDDVRRFTNGQQPRYPVNGKNQIKIKQ
jgi:D-3-phosphoglycerate dehydrogenase